MADYLFAGAFNPAGEGGYSVFSWDEERGAAEPAGTFAPEVSVGMHAYDARRGVLYLTDERTSSPEFEFGGGGRIFAMKLSPAATSADHAETGLADAATGNSTPPAPAAAGNSAVLAATASNSVTLTAAAAGKPASLCGGLKNAALSVTEISRCPSFGAGASYCLTDKDGEYLLATNFGGHSPADAVTKVVRDENGRYQLQVLRDEVSTVLFKLNADGSIAEVCDVFHHLEESASVEAADSTTAGGTTAGSITTGNTTPDGTATGNTTTGSTTADSITTGNTKAGNTTAGNAAKGCTHNACACAVAATDNAADTRRVLRLPHAHSLSMSPDGQFFAVCDMGCDKIWTFRIDRETDRLVPACAPHHCRFGSGPRYSAFHPAKPFFFANFEEKPYVASYRVGEDGSLTEIANLELISADEAGESDRQSGMILSPDGRFLYACMRGLDTIEVIGVDPDTGELSPLQRCKTHGERLKDCALSPDGRHLAVAGRGSGTVEIFDVRDDGTLAETGTLLPVKNAGHVFFLRV